MSLAQQKLSCHGAGETWEMGTGPATDSNGDSGITLARSTPTGDRSGLKAEGPRQADRWGRPSLTGSHAGSHRVLAATLSAHGSAAFDVDVLAGLGGDATLRRQGGRSRRCRGC